MHPGAALQAFGEIGLAVERAGNRLGPLLLGLHLDEGARGAQLGVEPSNFVLEDG